MLCWQTPVAGIERRGPPLTALNVATCSYGEAQAPDVWFEAVAVWEVKAADLSLSPVHKAALGLVDELRGVSIRFPRLVRVRDDKRPEQATSAAQVAEMYRAQAVVAAKRRAAAADEDDEGL